MRVTSALRAVLVPALVLVAGIVALGFVLGRGGADEGPPARAADFRGVVTDLQRFPPSGGGDGGPSGDPDAPVSSEGGPSPGAPRGDVLGSFLVEEDPSEPWGGGKDRVTVTKGTRIWRDTSGTLSPAAFDDLRVGQVVEVWYTGPIAESYPRQATAEAIVILGAGGE